MNFPCFSNFVFLNTLLSVLGLLFCFFLLLILGAIDMAETNDDMDEDYKYEEDVAKSEIDLDVDSYE
jgi:hypothetical protein